QHFPSLLFDWHAPEVHAPAAVTHKIQVVSIRRPDRVPVHCWIICHLERLASVSRNGPYVSFPEIPSPLVRDSISMRRPVRFHRVNFSDLPLLSRGNIECPDSAVWIAS